MAEAEHAPSPRPSLRATFDALPTAVHLSILELSSPNLADRVRCCLTCKRWAALLREPAFWAHLSFQGASAEHLDDGVLLDLCRRASTSLLSLDLSADACEHIALEHDGEPLLAVLAAESVTANLRRLSVGPRIIVQNAFGSRKLLQQCPRLASAGVTVAGNWLDVADAVRLLPLAEGSFVAPVLAFPSAVDDVNSSGGEWRLSPSAADDDDDNDDDSDNDDGRRTPPPRAAGFSDTVTALAEALSHCRVDSLQLESGLAVVPPPQPGVDVLESRLLPVDLAALLDASSSGAEGEAQEGRTDEAAAAALGAALAHPQHGPRVLCSSGVRLFCQSAVFAHLCGALTEQSRLEAIIARDPPSHHGHDNAAVDGVPFPLATLAAALAPGRSRITTVDVLRGRFEPEGPAALFAALQHNTTVTRLGLESCGDLGGLAGATALAAALKENTALRSLRLDHALIGGCEGELRILEAAAERSERARAAGRAAAPLELAFRNALRRDAGGAAERIPMALSAVVLTLSGLELQFCGLGIGDAEAIARALKDPGCLLESLNLDNNKLLDAGGLAIAVALAENARASRLHSLSLSACRLGDAAAGALGAALAAQGCACAAPSSGGLRSLDLAQNLRLGAVGALGLAMGVRAAGGWLESVVVWPSEVDDAGRGALLRAAEEWNRRWLPPSPVACSSSGKRRRPLRVVVALLEDECYPGGDVNAYLLREGLDGPGSADGSEGESEESSEEAGEDDDDEFARALEEAIMNGEGEGGFGEVSGDEEEEGFWY